jgi:flagellar motor switch protein FliN/FliY
LSDNHNFSRSSRKALDMEQMQDLRLPIAMVLGKKKLTIREILNLAPGSVLILDRMAGENADLVVNNKNLAKGEVVVMNNHLGFRLVSLLTPDERLRNL